MVIATGFFDGVHLGHRFVIDRLVSEAKARGDESMVVTFWPHPRTVLQDGARELRLLTSLAEKRELLYSLGVDNVEVVPFSKDFSTLTAREYLLEYIIGRFGGKAILLGYDNRFGSDCASSQEIAEMAAGMGLEVVRTDPVLSGRGYAVSSTKIRQALMEGDVAGASSMLGYDYPLFGVVVAGKKIGRTIGFPTANMELYEPLKLVPGNGVYLVGVETLGEHFHGMCNVGVRPTVSEGNNRTVETNIFGFDEEIYGLDIKVTFERKIRDEVRFSNLESLRNQLCLDREKCLSLI